MREFTVPPVVTISEATTLVQAVWTNAEQTPQAPQFARRTATGWADISCAQFRDDVVAVARGLIAAGVAAGDRVGLVSRTRYEWTMVDYAIWACGAVTVPIYETSSPAQIEWILSDSGAVACFVETADHARNVDEVRGNLPDLKNVWEFEPNSGTTLADLIAGGTAVDEAEVDRRRLAGRVDDLATIIYTSGTTGRPKGCVLTHRNIYADIANAIPHLPSLFTENASTLLFLPLAHSFARLIQVGVVQARVHTAYTPDTRNLLPDLDSFKPTFVLAVPRVFEKVFNGARQKAEAEGHVKIFDKATRVAVAYSESLDAGGPGLSLRLKHALYDRLVYRKLRAAMGGECKAAVSGGAPLGARLAHFFRGIGVTIFEGYGLTETSPAVAVNLEGHIRIGTVGRPLPGVTVKIDNDGEILVKGDIVFTEYWNAPQATAEVLQDGWFHTGDLGSLDDDGYLSITGRKKEIIVTAGGKNVAPAVLEDRIRAHPLVSQCMVVGDRQPFVAALVTIDVEALPAWLRAHDKAEDAQLGDLRDDEDLRREVQSAIDEANQAVSKAESIRVFRILPEDFTEANGMLTPSLKVKRNIVAKEYADEIAAIYR